MTRRDLFAWWAFAVVFVATVAAFAVLALCPPARDGLHTVQFGLHLASDELRRYQAR